MLCMKYVATERALLVEVYIMHTLGYLGTGTKFGCCGDTRVGTRVPPGHIMYLATTPPSGYCSYGQVSRQRGWVSIGRSGGTVREAPPGISWRKYAVLVFSCWEAAVVEGEVGRGIPSAPRPLYSLVLCRDVNSCFAATIVARQTCTMHVAKLFCLLFTPLK